MQRVGSVVALLALAGCGPGDGIAAVPLEQAVVETTVTLPAGRVLTTWAKYEDNARRRIHGMYAPFTISVEVRDPNGESQASDCPDPKDSYEVGSFGFIYVSFPQCNLRTTVAGEYVIKAQRTHLREAGEDWYAENASLIFTD